MSMNPLATADEEGEDEVSDRAAFVGFQANARTARKMTKR
jgi:hypothetical protein